MTTTFSELKRRVFLGLGRSDGEAELAVEDAINQSQRALVRVQEFDELTVLDTGNAVTVANQKTYHITSNLALTRPKDILTIRYIDDASSRKLVWVPLGKFDALIPYPEQVSTARPKFYLQRGMYIDLCPIPNANKSLYITHTQWPAILSNETDETPFVNMDDIIVMLSVEISTAILTKGGGYTDWSKRARELLGIIISDQRDHPDRIHVAQPFTISGSSKPVSDYWLNPWVKE